MKFIGLVTYRGTLVVLNGLVFLAAVAAFALAGKSSPLLFIAPACGLAAFATARRHKPLLLLAVVANLLLALLSLPFTYFAVKNGIGLGWFTLLATTLFIVPFLTVFACWARWPRAVV